MKLANFYPKSRGYPLQDKAMMVSLAVHDCVLACEQHGVEPVGAFEMATTETWDGSDTGLRWEFTPDDGRAKR